MKDFRAECEHGHLVAQSRDGAEDAVVLIVSCPPSCTGDPEVPSVFVPEDER